MSACTAVRPAAKTSGASCFSAAPPNRRLRSLLVFALVVLSVVAARVIELQTIQGPILAAAGERDRTSLQVVEPTRGSIVDRDGSVLAMTVETRDIVADQTEIVDPPASAEILAPVLGLDNFALATRLTGDRRFVYVAKGITPQVWDQVRGLGLPGLFSQPSSERVYPAGPVGANIVGFVGDEGHGLSGLEYGYDSELAGQTGSLEFERSARGQAIPTAGESGTAAVAGVGLQLTIDRDLQFATQRALANQVQAVDAESATVVVMSPQTGQILALASEPGFDPSDPASSPASARTNRALADTFEPGSTAKVLAMAAALDSGKVTPRTRLRIPASVRGSTTTGLQRAGHTFHDSETHPAWRLTATGVLARSSNIGAILVAERAGQKRFYDTIRLFGVGQPTGLRFPGESRGFVPSPAVWSPTTMPTLAFGQGLTMNAVQVASVYSTIANDGVRVAPSLVSGYVGADGSITAPGAPTTTQVVSASTAQSLREMLESVVSDEGTAPSATIPGYIVAGKTGTANRVNPACRCYSGGGYTASFVGMAPASEPKLVIAVIVAGPRRGHYGSVVAAPVFKKVMTAALVATGAAPTDAKRAHLPVTW